ncbi:MAG TPA: hypothetical protein VKC56_12850 [Gallionellaceae bacterium]|nr:hypothetical protein [Gallionellaceae bacterium]
MKNAFHIYSGYTCELSSRLRDRARGGIIGVEVEHGGRATGY